MRTPLLPISVTILALAVLAGASLFLSSCITAPPKGPNLIEQVKEENQVGSGLAQKFERKLKFESDPLVDPYLERIEQALIVASRDPRLQGTAVAIIDDKASQWRSFSLPGRGVYLSLGFLKKMRSDNEVAALLAVQLGHIQARHVLNHLKASKEKTPNFFGPEGLFNYTEAELDEAIQKGVDLMYKSGFDARGMVSTWETERKYASHSFYSVALLDELIQNSRDAVSNYPPLRNPIVKSREFMKIKKRVQRL
jgi:predicted Zn-dependent protease